MTITNLSVFRSIDGGITATTATNGRMSGTAGDAIGLLNMLLLYGYNWQEVTASNLTQSGNVATLTLATHGFNIDQRLWIVGADQSGYTSDAVYPSSLAVGSFTYAVSGSPTSPSTTSGSTTANGAIASTTSTSITVTSGASFPSSGQFIIKIDTEWMLVTAGQGTTTFTVVRGFGNSTAATHSNGATVAQKILVGVAPAGGYTHWTADFTTTNKSTYRAPAGNRFWLDVDDTGTTTFQVRGYETMSATATGTGAFPTTGQIAAGLTYVSKSNVASTAVRAWNAVATDRGVLVWIDSQGSGNNPTSCGILFFTDLISVIKSGDAYSSILMYDGAVNGTGTSSNFSTATASVQAQCYMPRSYTQLGSAIQFGKTPCDGRAGSQSGSSQLTYPHPPDGGLYLTQVFVGEGSTLWRGILPFYWHIMHTKPATHMDTLTGTGVMTGKKFQFLNCYNSVQFALEISNTILNG